MLNENKKLYEAITDFLLETQLKLGFANMPIRVYYPPDSLARLLCCAEGNLDEALDRFLGDRDITECLGCVSLTKETDGRICLLIPAQGSAYVKDHGKAHPFLVRLIALVAAHAALQEIDALFHETSDAVVHRKMSGDDFDDLYYFADAVPDAYYYCLKEEADGDIIYHRFLKEDYLAMYGEEAACEGI